MAGIYIHVPFCKQRCVYCDFFSLKQAIVPDYFITNIVQEVNLTKDFLGGACIDTIYWGGGTPSLLKEENIDSILSALAKVHPIADLIEHTLECNPDDLSPAYMKMLKTKGINRLSIGVQSFHDAELKKMNRRHGAVQAKKVIQEAQDLGYDNISIDLIYGLPDSSLESWEYSLKEALQLSPKHLSAYILGYEPGTVLYKNRKKKGWQAVSEELISSQFSLLSAWSSAYGYEHYEISNFAKDKAYAIHNTSYWQGKKYLGLGPSAHSYDGEQRRWNLSSLTKYSQQFLPGAVANYEYEDLSIVDRCNEILMTGLRTQWGVKLQEIEKRCGQEYVDKLLIKVSEKLQGGQMSLEKSVLRIHPSYFLMSDHILVDIIF